MPESEWTIELEKQLGVRIQTVMGNPDLLSVFQKFGAEVFRRSSVFHGLEKMLAENKVRGKLCFEIGTWNALTSVVLSRFFDRVITVDVAHNAIKHEIIGHLGIKNIRCFDIIDNADKKRVADQFDYDFAYLDGNHAEDTEADWKLTNHCGRVLFHEAWSIQKPVMSLISALPRHEVVFGGHGLALWNGSK